MNFLKKIEKAITKTKRSMFMTRSIRGKPTCHTFLRLSRSAMLIIRKSRKNIKKVR